MLATAVPLPVLRCVDFHMAEHLHVNHSISLSLQAVVDTDSFPKTSFIFTH